LHEVLWECDASSHRFLDLYLAPSAIHLASSSKETDPRLTEVERVVFNALPTQLQALPLGFGDFS